MRPEGEDRTDAFHGMACIDYHLKNNFIHRIINKQEEDPRKNINIDEQTVGGSP